MQHKGTILLETNRLFLRRFTPDDSAAAFRNWTSDKRVTEFLRWPTHESEAVTKKVIKTWIEEYQKPNFYQWAIVLKENESEPIGTISVVEQNEALGIVHIGYCIGSKWWHMGITSEAFAGIIPFLFEQVKAMRVESQHDPRNENSGKVMQKCGLLYEGTLRQVDSNNLGICDAAMHSMLAAEYFEKYKKKELN